MGRPAHTEPALRPDNRSTPWNGPNLMTMRQIETLLSAEAPTIETLESTLTEGYAQALALEAERWRLEQRLSELAGELHEGDQDEKSQELAQISRRLSSNGTALEGLRSTLARLRSHATNVRGAA